MKYVVAILASVVSFQAFAEIPPVTRAELRAALKASPIVTGALAQIKASAEPATCNRLEIAELKEGRQGSITFKVRGVCISTEDHDSAEYFDLEGTMYDESTLVIKRVEFDSAG